MNGKKSKRLRQLGRHLMNAGAADAKPWIVYGREQKYIAVEVPQVLNGKIMEDMEKTKRLVATGSRMMDPSCGRAIYKSMKKRAA